MGKEKKEGFALYLFSWEGLGAAVEAFCHLLLDCLVEVASDATLWCHCHLEQKVLPPPSALDGSVPAAPSWI